MSHITRASRAFVDVGWKPDVNNLNNTSWIAASIRDISIPLPGWIEVNYTGQANHSTANQVCSIRFLPLTASGAYDTTITDYDSFDIALLPPNSYPGLPFALSAAWHIPTARDMKIAFQFMTTNTTGFLSTHAGKATPIRYTPAH